eukprot:403355564
MQLQVDRTFDQDFKLEGSKNRLQNNTLINIINKASRTLNEVQSSNGNRNLQNNLDFNIFDCESEEEKVFDQFQNSNAQQIQIQPRNTEERKVDSNTAFINNNNAENQYKQQKSRSNQPNQRKNKKRMQLGHIQIQHAQERETIRENPLQNDSIANFSLNREQFSHTSSEAFQVNLSQLQSNQEQSSSLNNTTTTCLNIIKITNNKASNSSMTSLSQDQFDNTNTKVRKFFNFLNIDMDLNEYCNVLDFWNFKQTGKIEAQVSIYERQQHYKTFAKIVGFNKKRKLIVDSLTKFQRQVKNKDQKGAANEHMGHKPSTELKQNQFSNLYDDLVYILKNREITFKDTNHIFDIYSVEKEQDRSHFKNLSGAKNENFFKRTDSKKSKVNNNNNRNRRNSRFSAHKTEEPVNPQPGKKIYSISISPITWEGKDSLLITVKDITHEKVINQKQLMDKLRNMIFKSFSHELKTPLNGIIMSVDTSKFISKALIQKLQKERQRGLLQLDDAIQQSNQLKLQIKVMESCSYVLKNIMHDFFDYHQLQTNELTMNVKEFEVHSFIRDIQRIVKQQMKFDKVQFKCFIEYDNPGGFAQNNSLTIKNSTMMKADKERLQQILLNLLMNSIKFTNIGSIELKVLIQLHTAPQSIIFKVQDTGTGIEQDRLPLIFNLFEKDENSSLNDYLNLNHKSARMGLPISQNLCQLMGGQIRVRSKINEGSIFSFKLPLNPQDDFEKMLAIQSQKINNILENTKSDFSLFTSRAQDPKKVQHRSLPHINENQIQDKNSQILVSPSNNINSLNLQSYQDQVRIILPKHEKQEDKKLMGRKSEEESKSDEEEYCCGLEDEEQSSDTYDSFDEDEFEEDVDELPPNSRHRGDNNDFLFQMQNKLGQFEFVFISGERKSGQLSSGEIRLDGNLTPQLRRSSEKFKNQLPVAKSSFKKQEQTRFKSSTPKEDVNTFSAQWNRIDQQQKELDKMKELLIQDSDCQSRKSFSSNESNIKQQKDQVENQINLQKQIENQSSIQSARRKPTNQAIPKKFQGDQLLQPANGKSKMMKQASFRQITLKNKNIDESSARGSNYSRNNSNLNTNSNLNYNFSFQKKVLPNSIITAPPNLTYSKSHQIQANVKSKQTSNSSQIKQMNNNNNRILNNSEYWQQQNEELANQSLQKLKFEEEKSYSNEIQSNLETPQNKYLNKIKDQFNYHRQYSDCQKNKTDFLVQIKKQSTNSALTRNYGIYEGSSGNNSKKQALNKNFAHLQKQNQALEKHQIECSLDTPQSAMSPCSLPNLNGGESPSIIKDDVFTLNPFQNLLPSKFQNMNLNLKLNQRSKSMIPQKQINSQTISVNQNLTAKQVTQKYINVNQIKPLHSYLRLSNQLSQSNQSQDNKSQFNNYLGKSFELDAASNEVNMMQKRAVKQSTKTLIEYLKFNIDKPIQEKQDVKNQELLFKNKNEESDYRFVDEEFKDFDNTSEELVESERLSDIQYDSRQLNLKAGRTLFLNSSNFLENEQLQLHMRSFSQNPNVYSNTLTNQLHNYKQQNQTKNQQKQDLVQQRNFSSDQYDKIKVSQFQLNLKESGFMSKVGSQININSEANQFHIQQQPATMPIQEYMTTPRGTQIWQNTLGNDQIFIEESVDISLPDRINVSYDEFTNILYDQRMHSDNKKKQRNQNLRIPQIETSSFRSSCQQNYSIKSASLSPSQSENNKKLRQSKDKSPSGVQQHYTLISFAGSNSAQQFQNSKNQYIASQEEIKFQEDYDSKQSIVSCSKKPAAFTFQQDSIRNCGNLNQQNRRKSTFLSPQKLQQQLQSIRNQKNQSQNASSNLSQNASLNLSQNTSPNQQIKKKQYFDFSGQVNQTSKLEAIQSKSEIEKQRRRSHNPGKKIKLDLKIDSNYNSEDSYSDKNKESLRESKCPQILVVDDVQMNRYAVEQMLSLIFNIKVLQAENGQNAIDTLIEHYQVSSDIAESMKETGNLFPHRNCCNQETCKGIQLILMDIEMPIMDGITASRKLKQIMKKQDKNVGWIPDIPIVALTAYMDEKDNCIKSGMSDFSKYNSFIILIIYIVTKPTSKVELQEILYKYKVLT